MEDYLYVGTITNTHGLKGEVKIKSDSDFKEQRFKVGNKLFISIEGQAKEVEILSHRVHKGLDLIKFKGLETIDDVEPYKGCTIHVHESQLEDLEEGQYYYKDLIGCQVFGNGYIGIVKDLLNHGANDLLVIKRESKKDVLVPFVDAFIETVDLEHQKIQINEIEGLID